ncbi:pirin-like isoform X8 [Mytilus californianus]|uniref:pirin-like isoform X2 n=1 Tax=Mytilus californianus TaxID=6549 RepID=UPI0022467351|nr:pirin-like isoform X2 [Mytilus californianus]XP_052077293.1 pirin-like isoform X4 [Mytilus californianus]XP_052077294.1 pirin-like isoform X5 [Mytilus californianus]XP_052077295.1 pirin-like isoform X6 [Mytilus californianus]XP_052077296.1 pirin-like isoform X7 [Mytilus californianus]XP_052077297.1 pirin-like isoform X8 [Mytilus californianus]
MSSRSVRKSVLSVEQDEGVGARVRRSIGRREIPNLDPFLMLDEFKGDGKGGFPDHPHRGFETVSYIIKGGVQHEDFCGHKGTLDDGDVQWMTAGRGIVHSEIPKNGITEQHGLQLWVNLAHKDKMIDPTYQELKDKDIPKTKQNGVRVKVIAGESLGIKSSIFTRTPTMYLDFKLDQGAVLNQPIPTEWNAFIYTLAGKVCIGKEESPGEYDPHHTVVLEQNGDHVTVENKNSEVAHFLLIAGLPLKEPIKKHGPFVMTTDEEIEQAISDYRNGRNGFEKALTWQSKYMKKQKKKM